MRVRLTVAYDGGPFPGWQSQADGNAVQDHLERAAAAIEGRRVVVHGSGRTDAGVHALGQVAHFDTARQEMSPAQWLRALNAHLPGEIRVMKARRAGEDFHARFSARGKEYRYRIHLGPVLPPLERGRCWHVPLPIDEEGIAAACGVLQGRHDFAAYAANRGKPGEDTTRTVREIAWRRRGGVLTLTFRGEGFLYKMARMLSGAIVHAGLGKAEVADLERRLRGEGTKWNQVAPAEGLYLARVEY